MWSFIQTTHGVPPRINNINRSSMEEGEQDHEQEYDNDHLSEMQEKLKEFQSALQEQENMMRTLL